MFKDLLDRAKRAAEEHLPEDILDAGRKLGRTVAAHAPAPVAEVIHYVTGEESEDEQAASSPDPATPAQDEQAASSPDPATPAQDEAASETGDVVPAANEAAPTTAAPSVVSPEPAKVVPPNPAVPEPVVASGAGTQREDPEAVLQRVKAKAEHGLKPEDRLVVVYATPDEQADVDAILKILETVDAEVRHNDLRREPQTARQLAKLTGVMVPPYVFINGRFWGARYDIESLSVSGDLPLVVANQLDEISQEARRIGHIQESFSDEISVDNVLGRWRQGHILCVDDLDSWYEVDREGNPHFFYQGGPRPVEDMREVAQEVVAGVEAEDFEATWQLEPSVHLP